MLSRQPSLILFSLDVRQPQLIEAPTVKLLTFSPLVTIIATVPVLCFVIPAYLRTRDWAFLLIALGYAIGLVATILDYTFALHLAATAPDDYSVYRLVRRVAYVVDSALTVVGIIRLARTAIRDKTLQRSDHI